MDKSNKTTNETRRYLDLLASRDGCIKNIEIIIGNIREHSCPNLPHMDRIDLIHHNALKLVKINSILNDMWCRSDMPVPPTFTDK